LKETNQIQRIVFLLTLLLLFLCLEEASGWPWSKKADPIPFPDAVEELYPPLLEMAEERYDTAMEGFWLFMSERQGHEDGYSLAQQSAAACARKLGLKQLATETYADIVRSSMDRSVTLQALEALNEITHEEVYDERTIVEELLYEKDFGTLPPELNNFVHYFQALMDFRNGYPRWASNHLEKIQGKDEYFHRGTILEALWALKTDQLETCRRLLEEVAREPDVITPVRNEAKKALARVLYEQGDFMGSYRLYREIEAPEYTLADVILEEAWAKYRQRDYKKAMGLLVAFTAPSFQSLFKPEQYLLQTLIYMQYCHYGAARGALDAFQGRYGEVLHAIRQRQDLTENPQSRHILEGLPAVQRVDAYLKELAAEQAALEPLNLSDGFREHVRPIYELKTAQVERRREKVWNREVERLKRILFDYQEQANLLAYESGMHQYAKVKEMYYSGGLEEEDAEEVAIPKFSRRTFFAFEGEFWSDELDDYTFFIEDYCDKPEKWLAGALPERDRMALKEVVKQQEAAEKARLREEEAARKERSKQEEDAEKEKLKQEKAEEKERLKRERAAEKEKARQEEERAKQERAAQKEQAEKQEAAKKERLRQEQEKAEQELAAQQAEAKRRAAIEKERLRQEKAAQEALAEERAAEKAKRKKDKATRKALEEQREDVERMATRKGGKAN
jgi:DNA segregation ATPase FtsK/SpoIIIE-like protein